MKLNLQKNKFFHYYELINNLNITVQNDTQISDKDKLIIKRNMTSVKKTIDKSFNLL